MSEMTSGTGGDNVFERVSKTAEIITDPESQTLQDFHEFLGQFFRPEEIEPIEVFQRELANKNPDVQYVFTALRDPHTGKLVSAAYGSVQKGVLAIRFTLTEANYRGEGISQEADDLLVKRAEEIAEKQGYPLEAYICEAVELSERYWNRLEIEPGNGMRRIYAPGTKEEIHYELPPLAWNRDGTPAAEGVPEHLQIAVKGQKDKLSVATLDRILTDWWQEWYIRPQEDFKDEEGLQDKDAWDRHCNTVWEILNEKILAPLRESPTLDLISKDRREAAEKSSA
ncbi:MAG: hypothetical protein WAY88_00760 [Minisyncoccia bacterium]